MAAKIGVLVVLLAGVFGLLQLNDQPGIGISIYGLVPIVLAAFWFGLLGGLLTGAGALGIFVLDQAISPAPDFSGGSLGWAIVNRGLLVFGVPALVTVLRGRGWPSSRRCARRSGRPSCRPRPGWRWRPRSCPPRARSPATSSSSWRVRPGRPPSWWGTSSGTGSRPPGAPRSSGRRWRRSRT